MPGKMPTGFSYPVSKGGGGAEMEEVQTAEDQRERERERAICFERSFQVAISCVLIDNSP